jgi:hypothetical protein
MGTVFLVLCLLMALIVPADGGRARAAARRSEEDSLPAMAEEPV